jgi:putative nucleotidyltransferase with HDIG domain
MNKFRLYLLAITLVGVAVALQQPWHQLVIADPKVLIGALSLCALSVLTERFSIHFPIGGKSASTSIAFIPLLTSVLALEPPFAVAIAITTAFIGQFVFLKRELLRGMFNVAQWVLTVVLASLVYESLGGNLGELGDISLMNIVALTITFFFANQLLVSIGVALNRGERVTQVFVRVTSVAGANIFYDLLISPLTVIVAMLYQQYWVGGLLMVVLPLLLIRHSYWVIHKLQRANKDILEILIKTIETRDPYTSGHSLRVAHLAKAIAEDMDLPTSKVDRIHMAALVHDIGKIEPIYEELLQKKGPLTPDEWRVIETHAAKGAEFLTTLSSFSAEIIAAVRHHHEKYDGTGYPDRISGDAIPLASRIIMLCDSIDAMLSDRPYRRALSIDQVRAELIRCSGSQFDPKVVQAILTRNTLERAATLVGKEHENVPPRLSIAV